MCILDFTKVIAVLDAAVGTVTPAAQLVVRHRDAEVFNAALGWLDPDTKLLSTRPDTLFDMASVSKLFTVTTFMTLVEADAIALEDAVSSVLPEFSGQRPVQPYEDPLKPGALVQVTTGDTEYVNADGVTFWHLLTHTSGLPAWRPLLQQESAATAREMALHTFFSSPIGAHMVYSDIGLILLGLAIESLTGLSLDNAVRERVIEPLGLAHTRYIPTDSIPPDNVAPTEFCRWRGYRVVGHVHDENAYRLGGIAGHAGLFSTAQDSATFGQMFLDDGAPVLKPETVANMTRLHTDGLGAQRGLGFVLWPPDPEASGNPFTQRAFGHTGFTGTSLWMDPERELVVALLTNEVYNGRQNRGISKLRVDVHRAIVQAVDEAQAIAC